MRMVDNDQARTRQAEADGSRDPLMLSEATRDTAAQDSDLKRLEPEIRTARAPSKATWWQGSQLTLLIVGGIITLLGNIGVAYYNGLMSRDQEAIKARNALDLEREKAKASLILQAIASNDPASAQRNILFFVESGFIPDIDEKIRTAANKYLPVLPSAGSTSPRNAITPADYETAFWTVTLSPDKLRAIDRAVDIVVAARPRLEKVGRPLNTPWYVVGVIWLLETGGSLDRHLHNGDPLADRTIHIPKGRPVDGQPPFAWEESAIDAMKYYGLVEMNAEDLGTVLNRIERVNGTGYQRRGVSTPYLWASTSGYTSGKFVADGVFDPTAESQQIGAVALLRRLHERGIIKLDTSSETEVAGSGRS